MEGGLNSGIPPSAFLIPHSLLGLLDRVLHARDARPADGGEDGLDVLVGHGLLDVQEDLEVLPLPAEFLDEPADVLASVWGLTTLYSTARRC